MRRHLKISEEWTIIDTFEPKTIPIRKFQPILDLFPVQIRKLFKLLTFICKQSAAVFCYCGMTATELTFESQHVCVISRQSNIRSYSPGTDTGTSFILELHIYVSLYLFTWYQNDFSFLNKLFRDEFIPVFIPNEIPGPFWQEISFWYHDMNWKRTSSQSLGRVEHACVSDLTRK